MKRIDVAGYSLNASAIIGVGPVEIHSKHLAPNGVIYPGAFWSCSLLTTKGVTEIDLCPFFENGIMDTQHQLRANADAREKREAICKAIFKT